MTDKQWVSELHRMVHSEAWPLLHEWWKRQLVERTLAAADPMAEAIDAARDHSGGCALLLAIENEVTTKGEYVHAKTRASTRADTPRGAQANGTA